MNSIDKINRIIYSYGFDFHILNDDDYDCDLRMTEKDIDYLKLLIKFSFTKSTYDKIINIYDNIKTDEAKKSKDFIINLMIIFIYDKHMNKERVYTCNDYNYIKKYAVETLYSLIHNNIKIKDIIKNYIDLYTVPEKYEDELDKVKYVYNYIIHNIASYICENLLDIDLINNFNRRDDYYNIIEKHLKSDNFINNEDFKDNKTLSTILLNNLKLLKNKHIKLESRD